MDFDETAYQEHCEAIRRENQKLLDIFRESIQDLRPKTVEKHMSNVDLYINDYLLHDEPLSFEEGTRRIDEFLGYFFIEKCLWSTPRTIKSTTASIKKFYKCMLQHGMILKSDYEDLCEDIREGMPEWQEACAQYNDPDKDSPFDIW
jgi:hypothetical protein